MAVSQSQVDQIIASASSDDPEVKLLQLQDEVDLIKTSIKRLLIDIRERLNDLENPIVSSMANAFHDTSSDTEAAKNENRTSTDVKKADQTAVHDIPQHEGEVSQKQEDAPKPHPTNDSSHEPLHAQTTGQPGRYDAELLASIKSQIAALPKEDENAKASIADKVRLQKVYRLFQWTARNVKRFGHDRVDLMLDAYHAMDTSPISHASSSRTCRGSCQPASARCTKYRPKSSSPNSMSSTIS